MAVSNTSCSSPTPAVSPPRRIRAQNVRGCDIFANPATLGQSKPVDQFYACGLGKTAAEIKNPNKAATTYQALYTDALLDALTGTRAEVDPDDADGRPCHLVRPRTLQSYLHSEVPVSPRARAQAGQPEPRRNHHVRTEPGSRELNTPRSRHPRRWMFRHPAARRRRRPQAFAGRQGPGQQRQYGCRKATTAAGSGTRRHTGVRGRHRHRTPKRRIVRAVRVRDAVRIQGARRETHRRLSAPRRPGPDHGRRPGTPRSRRRISRGQCAAELRRRLRRRRPGGARLHRRTDVRRA